MKIGVVVFYYRSALADNTVADFYWSLYPAIIQNNGVSNLSVFNRSAGAQRGVWTDDAILYNTIITYYYWSDKLYAATLSRVFSNFNFYLVGLHQ